MSAFILELEVQEHTGGIFDDGVWSDGDIRIELVTAEEGHGFGLSEVIAISVSVGASVASELIADAIRRAVGGVIRRVKGRTTVGDGSAEGLTKMVDAERPPPP